MRKRRLVAGLAVAAAVGLALGFGLFPQAPLRRYAEDRLRRALGPGVDVHIGRLQVVPGLLRLDVADVQARSPDWSFELARGTLRLGASSLLGRARVVGLELRSPSITVRLDTAAPSKPAGTPPAGALALPAVITGLDVREGRLRLEAPDGSLVLEGWSLAGSIGQGSFEVVVPRGSWSGPPQVPLGPLQARLAVTPRLDVDLLEARAALEGVRLTAQGPVLRRGVLRPELAFEGAVDVERLAGLAGVGAGAYTGQVAVAGRLRDTSSGGDAPRLGADLTLDGSRLRLGGVDVNDARLSGAWDLTSAGGEAQLHAQVLGGRIEARTTLSPRRLEGTARATGVDLARVPGAPASWSGSGEAEARWAGDPARALDVSARVSVRGRPGEGVAATLRAEASGEIAPSSRRVDLTWSIHAEGRTAAGVETMAEARGRAVGALPPTVHGELSASLAAPPRAGEGDAEAGRPLRVEVTGSFTADTRRQAARLRAALLGGTLDVDAALDGPQVTRFELIGEGLDLAGLGQGLSGTARLEARASGPTARASLAGSAAVDALAWRGRPLGPLSLVLSGDAARPRIVGVLPELNAQAEVALEDIGGRRGREVAGRVALIGTPVAAFAPPAEEGTAALEGAVSAEARFELPLTRPEEGRAGLAVESLSLRRGEIEVNVGPFRVDLANRTLSLDRLALRGAGLRLEAQGSAPLPGAGRAEGLDLRVGLEADLGQVPGPPGLKLGGAASAALAFSGATLRPRVDGRVHVSGLFAESASLPMVTLPDGEIRFQGDRASLPGLRFLTLGGSATLEGTLPFAALTTLLRDGPLRREDEARLALAWEGLRAEALGAVLSGRASLEGGLATLAEPRVHVEVPATALRLEDQDLDLNLEPLAVEVEGGTLRTGPLVLTSPKGSLRLDGRFDMRERTLEARGKGSLDLRALSPLVEEAALRGTADLDLAVSGPIDAPRPQGSLRLQGGSLRLRLLPQALTGIDGSVSFDRAAAKVELKGRLGGGSVDLAGSLALSDAGVGDVHLAATGRDLALEYPPGLRTRLGAELTLTGRPGALLLAGDVRVERGLYDLDVAIRDAARAVPAAAPESALLRSIALDVRLDVERPVLARNDQVRLEAAGSLNVRGDMQEPAPFGRLDVRPGGKVDIQGREFDLDSGGLSYSGTFDPAVSLAASAQISGSDFTDYAVQVAVSGTLDAPSVSLSSSPSLSEGQIASLIATGAVTSGAGQTGAWLVGGQAATLFSARLKGLASTFGLDQISIRPDLVARDTDPGARFTFGKRLGRALDLVYSVGLGGPEARFVQMQARPGADVVLTFQRRDDGLLTWGAGQRFRLRGAARPATAPSRRRGARAELTEVRFEGETGVGEEVLRERITARPGKRASSFALQDDADRLRELLRENGYLEAEAAARLEGAMAIFEVRAGARYTWRVDGMEAPPDLEAEVKGALFEEEALDKGRERLLRALWRRGHLGAKVEARAVSEPGLRILSFRAEPGPVQEVAAVVFPGASALDASILLRAAGGERRAAADPAAARAAVEAAYRERFFLAATAGPARRTAGPRGIVVEIPVEEGPRARVAEVRFEGASLPADELAPASGLVAGSPYDDAAVTRALQRLRGHYFARGFPQVRVRPERVREGNDLAVIFQVDEGEAMVVGPIEVRGATRTRLGLVRRQLGLQAGRPVDPRQLAEAERRLLDLGVFSRASLRVEPVEPAGAGPRPARVVVEVEEDATIVAGYDLRWNEDDRLTALVEGERRNLTGIGLALGARYRFGADIREARGSLHLPALLRGADFTGSVFSLEEDIHVEDLEITRRQRGFQVQQTLRLPHRSRLLLGYRFRRNTVLAPDFPAEPIDVGGADLSVVQDTLDNHLDASRGRFLSLNLEVAPAALGSDAPFVKGFAQALLAHPVAGPSLTWAHSYRVGLAWGLGGEPLNPLERFMAGGPSSLRGFATNAVGPRDVFGDPAGGEAVAILNQELRFRHASGLGAVVFYDAGNVFPTVDELRFDLRHTAGLGLRWTSPVGLLRLDLGFPLGRREGEKGYRLFFGVGQAF